MSKELEIDLNDLHTEWTKQPLLVIQYNDMLAVADRDCNAAKDNLSLVEASMNKAICDVSEKKPTDKQIDASIKISEEYQQALQDYREKQYQYNAVRAMCTALEHRKKALENAVQLWIGGYFSTPKQPTGSNIDDDARTSQHQKQRKSLKKK